jgi:hypothetical protein
MLHPDDGALRVEMERNWLGVGLGKPRQHEFVGLTPIGHVRVLADLSKPISGRFRYDRPFRREVQRLLSQRQSECLAGVLEPRPSHKKARLGMQSHYV